MSRGFENIFEKYNITYEAPQKRKKYSKTKKLESSTNENQKKKEPNKNRSCLSSVSGHEDPTRENQDTQFDINSNNLSLPSTMYLSESNSGGGGENLKSFCNKNDKMWQLMKSTRQSLNQFKPSRKSNKIVNKTCGRQLSKVLTSSSLMQESSNVYRDHVDGDEMEEGELNKSSTSQQTTINENNNQTMLNTSLCSNSSTTEENTRKIQNSHHQGMPNKSILAKSHSFDIKKRKPQTNRSRFKPLDITITQKPMSLLNTCTIDPEDTKNLPKSKNLDPNRSSHDLSFSSSSSSSSDEEDESFHPFISSSPKPSQIIDTPTTSSQKSTDQPTELDLLLELIDQDDKKNASKTKKSTQGMPSPKKSYLKGGYEELFIRALDRVKISGRYLKHDKKFGLKNGIPLKVVKLETSYNINVATVECMEYNNVFCIVVAPEMVTQIKAGTMVEAFFDDTSIPYKLQTKEGHLDLFLEPYKLLVV